MQEQLKELGLTDNEISVYQTLIDIGENSVGPIIKKTNMHRQVAYDALLGLEKKDMIIKTTKNGRNNYRIANPQNIIDNIRHKEKVATVLINEVNKLTSEHKEIQEIKIYEGKKAFTNMFIKNDENTPIGYTNLIITAANKEWEEIMISTGGLERSNRIRKKRNIYVKLIYDEKDRKDAGKVAKENIEHRFLDRGHSPPMEIAIWHDSVVIQSFGKDVFAIQVKNKKFQNTYKEHFNKLWEIAKE